MNRIIERIVEIDRSAQKLITDADAFANGAVGSLPDTAETLKKEASDKTDADIAAFLEKKELEFSARQKAVQREEQDKIARMRALCDAKREEWINEYYNDVISVEQ